MSGRTRQASALRFLGPDQFHDLGLKCILRRVNGADRFSERLLLEFLLNRQAEFRELFDIRSRMKLQFFKFGEDYKRFLQLCWFYGLSWLCSFGLWNSALGRRGSLLFGLDVPGTL